MYLCGYKQKIRQCEILLAHTGLKTIPHSLAGSVESTFQPTLHSGQIPSQNTREVGQPLTTKWDAV